MELTQGPLVVASTRLKTNAPTGRTRFGAADGMRLPGPGRLQYRPARR
ncbi:MULTISPECIES: hypothetical protein [unclassified Streptomyces]